MRIRFRLDSAFFDQPDPDLQNPPLAQHYFIIHHIRCTMFFCAVQMDHRPAGKTNFLIWRHSKEQVYLGYNHNKSQHRVRITCLISREGGIKRIFCLLLAQQKYSICVSFCENHPMFTILEMGDYMYIYSLHLGSFAVVNLV